MNDDAIAVSAHQGQPPAEMVFVSNVESTFAQAVFDQLAALFPLATLQHSRTLELAATGSQARIVLAMLQPIEAVATRLAAGSSAENAVTAWVEETEPLVAACRRLRRRLWCVDARSMMAGSPDSLALPGSIGGAAIKAPAFYLPPTVTLIIADLLIAHHPAALRLAMEINAMVRGPQGVVIDTALLADAQREVEATRFSMSEQKVEMELLRENLAMHIDQAADEARLCAAQNVEIAELTNAVADAHLALTEHQTELQLLRDTLSMQADLAEDETRLRHERQAGVAGLISDLAAARLAVTDQETELELLRESVSLLVKHCDDEEGCIGDLTAEVARHQELVVANALLTAEMEALKYRLAEAIRLGRARDSVMGRVLLADQAGIIAMQSRSENLVGRLLKVEIERDRVRG